MKMNYCCGCGERRIIRWVTIKGLDVLDGATIWEYGPGSGWAHHYGLDAITGIEPVITDPWVPDRYVIRTQVNGIAAEIGNRNSGTLAANCEQAIKITKLDSLDGTQVSSVLLECGFVTSIEDSGAYNSLHQLFALSYSSAIVAGLSNGYWATIGNVAPAIELLDFTSNGATKEYVLHAHTNTAGQIAFTTRGGATLALAYNASAATVETAIEALAGVTSATCTGGPWPWRKIEVEVVWASSTNDFASIAHSGSLSASAFTTAYTDPGGGQERLTVTPTVVAAGSLWSFSFPGGNTFAYTALTSNVSSFLTAITAAMSAFKTAQGVDGFWDTTTITNTGTALQIDYSFGITPLVLLVTGGTGGRSVEAAVTVFDPATGLIENAAGYNFGFPDGASTWLITQTATAPSYTGQDIQAPVAITAAASAKIVASGQRGGQSWVQSWTTGSTWALNWTKNRPGASSGGIGAYAESDTVIVNFPRLTFTDGVAKTRCGATIAVSTGTVTELDNSFKSTATLNNDNAKGFLSMLDDTPADVMISGLRRSLQPSNFQYQLQGVATTWDGTTNKSAHGETIGWNDDTIFAYSTAQVTATELAVISTIRAQPIAFSGSRAYAYEFYTEQNTEFNDGAQFRFRFVASGQTTLETAWLDWDATNAEIDAALIAVFGENTEGVVSNIIVNAFGDPPALTHPTSLLERGLTIQFATQTAATVGMGFIFPGYVSRPLSNVQLQVQNTAAPFGGRIMAYNTSDGEELWSREFGTKVDTTIGRAYGGWLQGDLLYLYGDQVENDLP